jgi:2-desacetyl-2-hydroxyethyl bacteriochlorophyllide A dehydrogenase
MILPDRSLGGRSFSERSFSERSFSERMLAAVYHGPDDLRLESVPLSQPGPGEVLLRVESASICGTDLRILHGQHRKYPPGTLRIPGHEMVGQIAALGPGVEGYPDGQRLFVAPNWGCGRCPQCVTGRNNRCADYGAIGVTRDGAFAEYVLIPAAAVAQGNLMPVSSEADPAVLALIEPFACVLHGQDVLEIQPGETVLVLGAGPIGLMHLLLARLRGAGQVLVSEPRPERRALAERLGAGRLIDPSRQDLAQAVAAATAGQGADAIVVAAPVHALMEQAPGLAAIGGRINFFAGLPKDRPSLQIDANLVHYREIRLTGTTACSTADCRRAAALVSGGQVDLAPLVSQRFPLREAREAFAAAEDRQMLKVVLEP